MKEEFKKQYQVWERDGGSWYFNEYDTLEEAIESVKYGNYRITQTVSYKVKENTK